MLPELINKFSKFIGYKINIKIHFNSYIKQLDTEIKITIPFSIVSRI